MRWPKLIALAGCAGVLLVAAAGAETKLTFVDLQPKGNHKLADDMHDTEGNNLASLPQGELTFEKLKFKIGEKLIRVKGQNAPDVPTSVEGIKVDAKFERLHILHANGYGEPNFEEGTEIGAYIVHYEDKTTARIPIVYGEDTRDWWDSPDRPDLKRAKVAWRGKNKASTGMGVGIRLFAVAWQNPHPDKKVVSIDLTSKETMCDPFLVALTLESK